MVNREKEIELLISPSNPYTKILRLCAMYVLLFGLSIHIAEEALPRFPCPRNISRKPAVLK